MLIGTGSPVDKEKAEPGMTYWDTESKSEWVKEEGYSTSGWYKKFGPEEDI